MNNLYGKNELGFSLMVIGLYVVMTSLADSFSASLGTEKIITAPLHVFMTVAIARWVFKSGLAEKYGIKKIKIDYKKYLYFLPLAVIASVNLWNGVALRLSVLESVLYVVSMLCVGFLEEIIFRGFLFKALCKTNVRRAIVISSVTFGIGHIVNLLNGRATLETLLQVCYAVAIGFLFTIIFNKTKSLLPCIVTHGALNSMSAFGVEGSDSYQIVVAIVLTLVSLLYAGWIIKAERGPWPETE